MKAELTATERVGIHRYTFPQSDNAHFLLDLIHGGDAGPTLRIPMILHLRSLVDSEDCGQRHDCGGALYRHLGEGQTDLFLDEILQALRKGRDLCRRQVGGWGELENKKGLAPLRVEFQNAARSKLSM